MTTIIVTWNDGAQEVYHADSFSVDRDQLSIHTKNQPAIGSRESYHLPLVNIKVWKEEK